MAIHRQRPCHMALSDVGMSILSTVSASQKRAVAAATLRAGRAASKSIQLWRHPARGHLECLSVRLQASVHRQLSAVKAQRAHHQAVTLSVQQRCRSYTQPLLWQPASAGEGLRVAKRATVCQQGAEVRSLMPRMPATMVRAYDPAHC
jgi:hypothetical protein